MVQKRLVVSPGIIAVARCDVPPSAFWRVSGSRCMCQFVEVFVYREQKTGMKFDRGYIWWASVESPPEDRLLVAPELLWYGGADRFPFRPDGPLAYLQPAIHSFAHKVLREWSGEKA